jgi:uncharacterized protein YggT (Ycf19 family)
VIICHAYQQTKMNLNRLRDIVEVVLKLFSLGLFVRVMLSWVKLPMTQKVEKYLDRFYFPFLTPVRKAIKPIQLNTTPPFQVDLSPIVVLLVIWWLVYPFLMWILK